MSYLYILSEGEKDEFFYERIAERVTGCTFECPSDFRLRNGANWKTALATSRILLNKVKHWNEPQNVAVILAIDNDRAPGHPGSYPHPRLLAGHDLKKLSRYPAMMKMVTDALGADRAEWPVDVAVAIPVEMIESWILLLHNPARPTLPLFAEFIQPSTRTYYGRHPPPQLKDLCKADAAAHGQTLTEYFWKAAEQDIETAAQVSPSFRMFIKELQQWRCKPAS